MRGNNRQHVFERPGPVPLLYKLTVFLGDLMEQFGGKLAGSFACCWRLCGMALDQYRKLQGPSPVAFCGQQQSQGCCGANHLRLILEFGGDGQRLV
jgi:hypothetical protein